MDWWTEKGCWRDIWQLRWTISSEGWKLRHCLGKVLELKRILLHSGHLKIWGKRSSRAKRKSNEKRDEKHPKELRKGNNNIHIKKSSPPSINIRQPLNKIWSIIKSIKEYEEKNKHNIRFKINVGILSIIENIKNNK